MTWISSIDFDAVLGPGSLGTYHEDIREINEHGLVHILSSTGDVETDSGHIFSSAPLDEVVGNRELENLEGGVLDGVGKMQCSRQLIDIAFTWLIESVSHHELAKTGMSIPLASVISLLSSPPALFKLPPIEFLA